MKVTALDVIRGFYNSRRERNGSYSLSAFARDLGLSVSSLSRVLNGRRPVSLKLGLQISTALGLDEASHKKLVAAILASSTQTSKISTKLRRELEHQVKQSDPGYFNLLEVDQFQSMSQWYHLAILNLVRLPDFKGDPVLIGRKLGITSSEAQGALERLQKLNLLEMKDQKLVRTSKSFFVKVDKSHLAVRKFHTQMIQKALLAIEAGSDGYKKRHITGTTITCSSSQLEAIKDMMDKFHSDVIKFLEQSTVMPDSVYQINTQLFSLTKEQK